MTLLFVLSLCAITFIFSAFLVKLIIKLAHRYFWFDHIDERKIHTGQVPRLGGVAFIPAYLMVIIILTVMEVWKEQVTGSFVLVLVAMVFIVIFGIWDDFKPLRARYKALVQMIAALLVVFAGYQFRIIGLPWTGGQLNLGVAGPLISVIWIVGIINAINLIDGVDGLAGGVSSIILLSYAVIYAYQGNMQAVMLCLLLIAGIGGFLVFNAPTPRAKIFMGDTGSQFLGFIIALMPLMGFNYELPGRGVGLPFAAALTLIPIFDTFAAMWRRIRDGRSIYTPDREHTHHKLINLGLTAPQLDALLYGVQTLIGIAVILALTVAQNYRYILLLAAYIVGIAFFTVLHYMHKGHMLKGQGDR
ncbi:glycosyltransferase family 4 protein [Gracilinema caldarium]|uniref:Glycosyl transferase family 4 n=1 Tax=Gracilinema caldarium (strain ATCC 51460 / DSM 7334 / H1) TaxID=744872 RepID=F8F2S5_GRAC1|nr:MraY family glycosyltransferase [Gracilinema caldarium]AEJ19469.1 glycosyl transferase family 4 [Gracilinema caldarium DSM 7334]